MKIIELKINVKKITKSKLYQGAKGSYLSLTVAVADTPDQYGNEASAWESQSEEERKNKSPRNYLGNGKIIWTDTITPPSPITAPSPSADTFDDLPW